MFAVLLMLACLCCASNADGDGESASGILRALMQDYDSSDPPLKDKPTEVKIGIYINSFYAIDEKTMEYSVTMYLRQAWKDPRLAFDSQGGKQPSVRVPAKDIKSLWLPDTFFRNEKRSNFHDVTVDNKLLSINSSGNVWYVSKISGTFACPMKLQRFPFDTQLCPLIFESFGYTMDVLYYSWLLKPIDIDPDVQLPEFVLKDTILYDCSQSYTAGAYTCLEVRFVLERDSGFYVLQLYLPNILIVIMSWLPFYIDPRKVEARFVCGILLTLIMTTSMWGSKNSMPPVSYVQATDIWSFMCLFFLFAALLEFTVVSLLSRRKNASSNKGEEASGEGSSSNLFRVIDVVSMMAFPTLFLLFNIIYWAIYSA